MSRERRELTRAEILERGRKQAAGYETRIQNQKDAIGRLLHDPDAAAEVVRLLEELSKAHDRVRELEEYISGSSSSSLEIITKEPIPDDPAELKTDEAPELPWKPPVDPHRPTTTLPSL